MRRVKLKNKKKKSKLLLKICLLVGLFSFSFCFTLRYFKININNEQFIKLLLNSSSSHMKVKKDKNLLSKIVALVTDIDINKPNNFLNNNSLIVKETSSDQDIDIDSNSSVHIKDPYPNIKPNKPKIYIYNTHQSEQYSTTNIEAYNITPTVMMASYIIREKLNNNGIETIVEENNVTDILRKNNWKYASSYKVTKTLMQNAYTKESSLEYFIDIHRDSVNKNISTTAIGDKTYAKILFIVGLENKNYEKNLNLTTNLNDLFNKHYPGLSRGIYKKQGTGVNGVYNQDFNDKTILIEVGGPENTIDEVYNTCEAISDILTRYIGGSNEK